MNDFLEREKKLYQIIINKKTLYIDNQEFILVPSTPEIKLGAIQVYNESLHKTRFDQWLTDSDCLRILVDNNLCSPDIDDNLQKMEKELENIKVKLYQGYNNNYTVKKFKNMLRKVKKKQVELINIRHSLDYLTAQGFAETERRKYIIVNTLYHKNGDVVWDKVEDADWRILEKVMEYMVNSSMSSSDLREIARKDPWRTYWSMHKTNPFNIDSTFSLTEDQKNLVLYTRMYDSAFDHPDCPEEMIINDDDAFDGWMIFTRREIERKKKENKMEKQSSKLGKADEVYIPASNAEERAEIESMNDLNASMIKKQRQATLKLESKKNEGKKGKKRGVLDSSFADRKSQIQMKANQQFKANFGK